MFASTCCVRIGNQQHRPHLGHNLRRDVPCACRPAHHFDSLLDHLHEVDGTHLQLKLPADDPRDVEEITRGWSTTPEAAREGTPAGVPCESALRVPACGIPQPVSPPSEGSGGQCGTS